ncbi:hypothetical protein T552_00512 [Pneumocystis carinii B80]|uniref:Mitochondrial zinc maintenance protein 1, mitochondrial n=1 Tax=Pneumocystis carinii (strain B80) TaxID=1408658 RepID=A0A0W4ZR11_PNEC8|nr:hypothetical protein T552_00512 [Pneumocystis carinii B80]KTW30800.1 hypothetical protein T552_00512 [Pneumocystis carinii B80]
MTYLEVLSSYRNLLRAVNVAFKDDLQLLKTSKKQIRNTYYHDKDKNLSEEEIQKKIKHANDVASILRKNIVQGRLNSSGHYSLRIHHDTERTSSKIIEKRK